jgi:hypothetical protein
MDTLAAGSANTGRRAAMQLSYINDSTRIINIAIGAAGGNPHAASNRVHMTSRISSQGLSAAENKG